MLTPVESIRRAYIRWKSIPVQSDIDTKVFDRFMKAIVMMSGSQIDHHVLDVLWSQGSILEQRSNVHRDSWTGLYYSSIACLHKGLYCALTDQIGYNPRPYIGQANSMITEMIQYWDRHQK